MQDHDPVDRVMGMSDSKYTLYKSTTCVRCPLAERSMKRAGVDYDVVTLDAHGSESELADFREEAGRRGVRLEMPIVRTPSNDLLTNLATISQHFSGVVS